MKQDVLRILFVAAEAAPFVKVGGLGDVVGSLPPALLDLSSTLKGTQLDIRVAIPFHAVIPRQVAPPEPEVTFSIPTPAGSQKASAYLANFRGIPAYLIDGDPIPKEGGVYSLDTQKDGEKFTFFSLACLELCRALQWKPDILHAHDWHAALAIHQLAEIREHDPFFRFTRGLLTVHNLPYMGAGTDHAMRAYGIKPRLDPRLPPWGSYQPLPMGLAAADHITTVSPTYSREILTSEFGCGLETFLQSRASSLTGILNGLDMKEWDPTTDRMIRAPFSRDDLSPREENRKALLEEVGLDPWSDAPLLILVSRFDRQKGIDLVADALRQVQSEPWQAILLGSGDPLLEESARRLELDLPGRVRAVLRFDSQLSRRMFAGGDVLLMPSRYEPCGLTQMIAMRYGCLPVAHATGGLRDTIIDLDDPTRSSGFLFETASTPALAAALRRAFTAYADRPSWVARQRFAMSQDFSWSRSAQAYLDLYNTLTDSTQTQGEIE